MKKLLLILLTCIAGTQVFANELANALMPIIQQIIPSYTTMSAVEEDQAYKAAQDKFKQYNKSWENLTDVELKEIGYAALETATANLTTGNPTQQQQILTYAAQNNLAIHNALIAIAKTTEPSWIAQNPGKSLLGAGITLATIKSLTQMKNATLDDNKALNTSLLLATAAFGLYNWNYIKKQAINFKNTVKDLSKTTMQAIKNFKIKDCVDYIPATMATGALLLTDLAYRKDKSLIKEIAKNGLLHTPQAVLNAGLALGNGIGNILAKGFVREVPIWERWMNCVKVDELNQNCLV